MFRLYSSIRGRFLTFLVVEPTPLNKICSSQFGSSSFQGSGWTLKKMFETTTWKTCGNSRCMHICMFAALIGNFWASSQIFSCLKILDSEFQTSSTPGQFTHRSSHPGWNQKMGCFPRWCVDRCSNLNKSLVPSSTTFLLMSTPD